MINSRETNEKLNETPTDLTVRRTQMRTNSESYTNETDDDAPVAIRRTPRRLKWELPWCRSTDPVVSRIPIKIRGPRVYSSIDAS